MAPILKLPEVELSITSPVQGSVYYSAPVTVSGKASPTSAYTGDSSSVTSVEISVDGGLNWSSVMFSGDGIDNDKDGNKDEEEYDGMNDDWDTSLTGLNRSGDFWYDDSAGESGIYEPGIDEVYLSINDTGPINGRYLYNGANTVLYDGKTAGTESGLGYNLNALIDEDLKKFDGEEQVWIYNNYVPNLVSAVTVKVRVKDTPGNSTTQDITIYTVAYEKGISTVPHRAYGYVVEGDSVVFRDQSLTSAVLGDGGIYTSLNELILWDRVLYSDRLLPVEILQQAWTPGLEGYGFGWRIDEFRGHRRLWHSGSTCGFRNVMFRFPDDRLTIVILTNRAEPGVAALAEKLARRCGI